MKEVTRMEMACEAARSKRCRMTRESVRIGSERMWLVLFYASARRTIATFFFWYSVIRSTRPPLLKP